MASRIRLPAKGQAIRLANPSFGGRSKSNRSALRIKHSAADQAEEFKSRSSKVSDESIVQRHKSSQAVVPCSFGSHVTLSASNTWQIIIQMREHEVKSIENVSSCRGQVHASSVSRQTAVRINKRMLRE